MAAVGAILFAGCVGQAIVGEEAPESGGDGDEGGEPVDCAEDEPQPPGPPVNDFANLAGTVWEGYFEGGDDVTLVLGADGSGTYYVGERRDFDPPTDPDTGYLCLADPTPELPCAADLMEGFAYSVQGASVDARRVQFSVNNKEPWNDWCALQTPLRQSPSRCEFSTFPGEYEGYGTTHDRCFLENVDDPNTEERDCAWLHLAFTGVCECNSQECFSSQLGGNSFDLTANEEFTELSNSAGLRLFLVE